MFRSFRHKIIAMNLSLLMLFIISVSVLLYVEESKILIQVTKSNSMNTNMHFAEDIGHSIQYHVNQLNYIANEPRIISDLEDDMMVKMNYLMDSHQTDFIDILYAPSNMHYVSTLGQTGVINERDFINELLTSEQNHIISAPLYEHYEYMPAILIVVPVLDNKDIVGILGGVVDLNNLIGDFNDLKHAGDSYGWIIDSSGLVIGHPNPIYPLKIMIQDTDAAGYPGLSDIGRSMLETSSGYGEYHDTISNEAKFVTYATVPNTAGWKLAITTLKSDVVKPLKALSNKIVLYALLATLFYLFAIYFLSKNIVRPIEELTLAVKNSEKMNFSQLQGLEGNDELSHLVSAYNKMAQSLQSYTKDLKNQVVKRDEVLSELNEELSSHNMRMRSVNDEVYTQKETDNLTGLLKHSEIIEEIEKNIKHVDLKIEPFFSVMFIDLDNFKDLNEKFGHGIGDNILFEFSLHLKRFFRNTDIIGRYGGDEFIVVMMNTSENDALYAARNFNRQTRELDGFIDILRTLTRNMSLHIPDEEKIGASVGIATYTIKCGKTANVLIREADGKMHQMRQIKRTRSPKS